MPSNFYCNVIGCVIRNGVDYSNHLISDTLVSNLTEDIKSLIAPTLLSTKRLRNLFWLMTLLGLVEIKVYLSFFLEINIATRVRVTYLNLL